MPVEYNLLSSEVHLWETPQSGVRTEICPTETTEEKIASFADLPKGWDYGRGGPLSAALMNIAKDWNLLLRSRNLDYTDAFPGDSKITITGGANGHRIEVIICQIATGFLLAVAHDVERKRKLYKSGMDEVQALKVVANVLGDIWSAYTSSTRGSMTPRVGNLLRTRSPITKDRFRSWKLHAQVHKLSAHTSTDFVLLGDGLHQTPQSSGDLTQTPYLSTAA